MNIKSCKKSAGVVSEYLESIGKQVKFQQALEVVAIVHGASNWNRLQGSLLRALKRKKGEATAKDQQVYGAIADNYNKGASQRWCKKCGNDLDTEGWCRDQTCPYHDWQQLVPEASLSEMTTEAIEARYNTRKRSFVFANVYSDDHVYETEFDATPWFDQASDDEILALAAIGWGGDAEADEVARHFADSVPEVETLFDYLGRVDMGFECHVDRLNAMAWLKANRPEVWARILCEENEVSLSEAQEEEIRGMWDWIGPNGNACDHSFDTIGEAALDAVRVLGLSDDGVPEATALADVKFKHAQNVADMLQSANVAIIEGHEVRVSGIRRFVQGDDENEVFYLNWEVDGLEYSEKLTEDDLGNTRIDGNKLIVPDEDGEFVIELFDKVPYSSKAEDDLLFLMGKPALTEAELERFTEGNEEKLDVVVDVPWEYLGEGSDAVDQLNDYVSERITGSIAGLVDIGYEVYHMTDAERTLHGTPDKHTVMIRVSGSWAPDDI